MTVWVCQSCKKNNKRHVWKSKNTHNFGVHLENHHNITLAKRRRTARALDGYSSIDPEHAVEALVDFIVAGAHPFILVENKQFVAFCSIIAPGFQVPVRHTIRKKVMMRWQAQKERVRAHLLHDLQFRRASLTTDMWTSSAKRGYMVVTLHYVNST